MDEVTRRFLSIVVVAMMLLGGLLTALMLLPEPDEDGEEEDPGWRMMRDGVFQVYGDAVWSGWDTVLEHPVYLEDGSTLTVEGSRLEVPLERMVFEDVPPISLGYDSQLVLSNSSLVVDGDPQLATAILDAYYSDTSTPFIWRVLNLMDAEDPVLEMELELVTGEPYVVVAVQRPNVYQLEPLVVMEPKDLEVLDWVPVRVSLREWVGGTPRLVVLIHNGTAADVLIANVTVRDGDGQLPSDVFGLGGLRADGWDLQHLYSFVKMVDDGDWTINPLIGGWGDLKVLHSRIQSLPGLERDVRPYRPQMGSHHDSRTSSTLWKAPDAGGINVSGSMTFISSEIAYVPIEVDSYRAVFRDCSFVGDCEMLTIGSAGSTVSDCDFEFQTPEGLWGRREVDEETWMLSVEMTYGDTVVTGCTFTGEGHGTGLAVNHQLVDLGPCSFSGLDIGVWVHEGGPSMRWEALGSTLSFDGTCRVQYLETVETWVEFLGDNRPSPTNTYAYWTSDRYDEVPGVETMRFAELETSWGSRLCVPVTTVGPGTGTHEVDELEVWLSPNWAYNKLVTLSPYKESHQLWFGEEEEKPYDVYNVFYDFAFGEGNSTGALATSLYLNGGLSEMGSLYLNVSVDGHTVQQVDLNTTEYNWTSQYQWATVETVLSPGPHGVSFTAGLFSEAWNVTIELDRLTVDVFRVSAPGVATELSRWLNGKWISVAIIDPGVVIDGLEYINETDGSSLWLAVVAGDDAEVTFERIAMGQGGDCSLTTVGNATFHLRGFTGGPVAHTARGGMVTIGTMSVLYYMGTIWGTDLTFTGDLDLEDLWVTCFNNTSVAFEDLAVTVDDRMTLDAWSTQLDLKGCTISTEGGGRVDITSSYGSTMSLDSCEFVGLGVTFNFYDMNDTCNVVDCTFSGRRAFLDLNVDEWSFTNRGNISSALPRNGTVSGNTFIGEGAGLIFLPGLRGTILGVNRFLDGARAYAAYHPEDIDAYYNLAVVTMDSIQYLRERGGSWKTSTYWYDHMVEVTDDPLDASDPGLVLVVVRNRNSYYSGGDATVVGFQAIPVSGEGFSMEDYYWTNAHHVDRLIEELERELGKVDNWWTG